MRLAILGTLAFVAYAQVPDKFTNLQFYPNDITRPELMSAMRGFSFALGARCAGCHVGRPDGSLEGMDFASDAKPAKQTARTMLKMVRALNQDYIAKLPGAATRVECATCHHGLDKPRSLQLTLSQELEANGLEKALALYQELRTKYHGGAQYDFSETSLNLLTESLQAKGKSKEAAAFMELNAKVNTLSGWGRNLLAMAHRDSGEIDKAIADFQSAVEKNPKDAWARSELEKLKAKKQQ